MAQKTQARHFVVQCECGFEARGTLGQLYAVMRKHGLEAHNMKVTREGVAARAKPS